MATATKSTKKDTKRETVLSIFTKHKDKESHLPYREFRKLVVDEITKQTGVKNKGTLGMYFAWARREVLHRPAKQYNRSATRAKNGASKSAARESQSVSAAMKEAAAARAKARKAKASKNKAKKSKAKKSKAKARR